MENSARFPIRDYDLGSTLSCGQAFRWQRCGEAWEGVIGGRWVRLRQLASPSQIEASTAMPVPDWRWLTDYLRLDDDLAAQVATFPDDAPLRAAVAQHRGLRLLRQEPWECLASFILSSTKQVPQIQQCVALLCERFGDLLNAGSAVVPVINGSTAPATRPDTVKPGLQASAPPAHYAFPTALRLAAADEMELRTCKIGFRAKYLLAAARLVASGDVDLARVATLPLDAARVELMRCPGVGRKIADCTLLFSCGFDAAFPIDVWVDRALRRLYFPKRRVKRARLELFAATHFGPHAGLAQQYLFHSSRTAAGRKQKG